MSLDKANNELKIITAEQDEITRLHAENEALKKKLEELQSEYDYYQMAIMERR